MNSFIYFIAASLMIVSFFGTGYIISSIKKPRRAKYLIPSISILLGSIMVIITSLDSISSSNSNDKNSGYVFAGYFFTIIGIVGFILCKAYNKKIKNEQEKQIEQQRLKETQIKNQAEYEEKCQNIYKQCAKNNIRSINDQNIQSLMIVAKMYNIFDEETAKEYFYEGEKIVLKENRDKQIQEIRELREKDEEKYNQQYEEAHLFGKEKYTKELEEELNNALEQIQYYELLKSMDNYQINSKPVTHSSSVAGGVVSGLFGTAAGVVTAINVENKNAQIKANHERRAAQGRKDLGEHTQNQDKYKNKVSELEKKLKKIEDLLIDDSDMDSKFKMLKITNLKATVLKSGNVKVKGKVKQIEDAFIIERPALLDGSLKINVYNSDGNLIGNGYYTAYGTDPYGYTGFECVPYYKSEKEKEEKVNTMEVMCITSNSNITSADSLSIKVEPFRLWFIEKMD